MREQVKDLLVRELTESETESFMRCHAFRLNEMLICPDIGEIIGTNERVEVSHAVKVGTGVILGVTYLDGESSGKYSNVPIELVRLINPKFDWKKVADYWK